MRVAILLACLMLTLVLALPHQPMAFGAEPPVPDLNRLASVIEYLRATSLPDLDVNCSENPGNCYYFKGKLFLFWKAESEAKARAAVDNSLGAGAYNLWAFGDVAVEWPRVYNQRVVDYSLIFSRGPYVFSYAAAKPEDRDDMKQLAQKLDQTLFSLMNQPLAAPQPAQPVAASPQPPRPAATATTTSPPMSEKDAETAVLDILSGTSDKERRDYIRNNAGLEQIDEANEAGSKLAADVMKELSSIAQRERGPGVSEFDNQVYKDILRACMAVNLKNPQGRSLFPSTQATFGIITKLATKAIAAQDAQAASALQRLIELTTRLDARAGLE